MVEPDKKLVVSEGGKPCGCYVVKYSDDTSMINPCAPCGFMAVAEHLQAAANAIGAVGQNLREQQKQAALMQATAAAMGKGKS